MRQVKYLSELGTITFIALLTFACVPPKNTNTNTNSNANSNANSAVNNQNVNTRSADSGSRQHEFR
jgi:uncharacterized lipoprotein YajG